MVVRILMIAFVIIYAVCPDLLPGSVDDIVVALLGVYAIFNFIYGFVNSNSLLM